MFTSAYAGRSDDSTYLENADANGGNSLLLPNRNLDFGYTKLDLGGLYQLRPWLGVYFQGENLLSQQHIAPIGYPSLPMTSDSKMIHSQLVPLFWWVWTVLSTTIPPAPQLLPWQK